MYGNKQVGLGTVGYFGTVRQRNVHICRAGEYHVDIWIVVLNQFTELLCYRQGKVFFLALFADGAGFVSAVTWVNDQSFYFSGLSFL